MVDLIRKITPRDIVGGDVHSMYDILSLCTSHVTTFSELRMMDALAHIMFEVAGTSGDLLSVQLIKVFGNNFSFFITPPLFAMAGLTWSFIDRLDRDTDTAKTINTVDEAKSTENIGYFHTIVVNAKAFARSTYKGAGICFAHRRFIWLLPGYSFACLSHLRYSFGPPPLI